MDLPKETDANVVERVVLWYTDASSAGYFIIAPENRCRERALTMNNPRTNILLKLLKTAFGLAVFAFGVYLTISANIGLAPWDSFSMGISYHTPLTYGTAHIVTSCVIVVIDLLMREKIGYGTILDAVLVGLFVDLYDRLNLVPDQVNVPHGIAVMTAGLIIMSLGQFFYMSAGLSCGPRDAFLVGLGKRFPKLPIGVVNTIILSIVLCGGWIMGAPIGIGTVVATFGIGLTMQVVFKLLKFEPRSVMHQSLFETTRILFAQTTVEESAPD